MKLLTLAVLCAPLLLAGCGSPASTAGSSSTSSPAPSAADETAAVHAVFDTYTKAALAKDGATALDVLADTMTFSYNDLRRQALTGKEENIGTLPMSQRMAIYQIRAEYEPAALRGMTGTDLLRTSIDKGLVGENGIRNLSLGEVSVTGDSASAEIIRKGDVVPYEMMFLRQDGVWKLDLAPLLSLADGAFSEVARERGVTEDEMIDSILGQKYSAAELADLRLPLER